MHGSGVLEGVGTVVGTVVAAAAGKEVPVGAAAAGDACDLFLNSQAIPTTSIMVNSAIPRKAPMPPRITPVLDRRPVTGFRRSRTQRGQSSASSGISSAQYGQVFIAPNPFLSWPHARYVPDLTGYCCLSVQLSPL